MDGIDRAVMGVDKEVVEIRWEIRRSTSRLAETPESWSLEFQLDATFADNFGHICRQILYVYRQF